MESKRMRTWMWSSRWSEGEGLAFEATTIVFNAIFVTIGEHGLLQGEGGQGMIGDVDTPSQGPHLLLDNLGIQGAKDLEVMGVHDSGRLVSIPAYGARFHLLARLSHTLAA